MQQSFRGAFCFDRLNTIPSYRCFAGKKHWLFSSQMFVLVKNVLWMFFFKCVGGNKLQEKKKIKDPQQEMHNGISALAGDVALLWNVPWHRHDNFSPAPLSLCVAGVSSSSGGQLLVSLGSLLDDQHWHHVKLERLSTHLNLTVDKNTLQVQIPADLSHWHIHTVRGNTHTHTFWSKRVKSASTPAEIFICSAAWVSYSLNKSDRTSKSY